MTGNFLPLSPVRYTTESVVSLTGVAVPDDALDDGLDVCLEAVGISPGFKVRLG